MVRANPNKPALITDEQQVTYSELDQRVAALANQLGDDRRLVLLEATNTVDSILWYAACLVARHPVILTSPNPEMRRQLVASFDPDTVILTDQKVVVTQRRDATNHTFHDDLALLLSTSGTTTSPKLVRLSNANLVSNARAIGEYLHLSSNDRAITSLPMHYCYGLSVITSHLLAGASLVVTSTSVVDRCFWDLFQEHEATSLAGVPHTFDLLDRIGFADLDVPSLRYVTQAGGRLAPDRVAKLAAQGQQSGWQLFVMYGQTEATARMAYLDPDLVPDNPASIGQAIPGGSLHIQPEPGQLDDEVGEVIYRGPNVMLGYAHGPPDLIRGPELDELATGDLGRVNANGLVEIIGRKSRFIKPFGVRVDLDRLEEETAVPGGEVAIIGDDYGLSVGTTRQGQQLVHRLSDATGLPHRAIKIIDYESLPRLDNAKVDYQAIAKASQAHEPNTRKESDPSDLAAQIASVLNLATVDESKSFVELGGDSLSYIETSLVVERALGTLPPAWQTTPIAQLTTRTSKPRWWSWTESTMVLRFVAIMLIVSTHIGIFSLPAGAHILLAVAGFNFAQFQLRTMKFWPSIAKVAAPAAVWIGAVFIVSDRYDWPTVFFVNNVFGSPQWGPNWRYWFVEALLHTLVGAALLLNIPLVKRLERAQPFNFALLLVSLSITVRYDPFDLLPTTRTGARTLLVLWAFTLGWAAARAATNSQRVLLSLAAGLAIYDFFPTNKTRELMVFAGLLAVIWLRRLPLPTVAVWPVAVIAKTSLFTYLVHWQIYGTVRTAAGEYVALACSLAAGIAAWHIWAFLETQVLRFLTRNRSRTLEPAPNPNRAVLALWARQARRVFRQRQRLEARR